MPKSKKSTVVNLTKVKANRRELKRDLLTSVQECVDKYKYVYVFGYENMRTARFKDVRVEWSDSRFFMGKNRIIQKALGDNEESEYRPGLHAAAGDVSGNVGLLFTDREPSAVKAFFKSFAEPDYARAGFIPSETITMPAGRLEDLPHTMADPLRKLGMPIRLDKGVIVLASEFTLCTEKVPITPEQGRLLKHFGHQLAVFRLHLVSMWNSTDTTYTRLSSKTFGVGDGDASGDDESMNEA